MQAGLHHARLSAKVPFPTALQRLSGAPATSGQHPVEAGKGGWSTCVRRRSEAAAAAGQLLRGSRPLPCPHPRHLPSAVPARLPARLPSRLPPRDGPSTRSARLYGVLQVIIRLWAAEVWWQRAGRRRPGRRQEEEKLAVGAPSAKTDAPRCPSSPALGLCGWRWIHSGIPDWAAAAPVSEGWNASGRCRSPRSRARRTAHHPPVMGQQRAGKHGVGVITQ